MTTKKEILDCVKSIAEHQDLIAKNQNTERKAEAITTQKLLAEILRELRSIKNILEDAAKEPEIVQVQEDKTLADIFEDMNKTIKESTLFDTLPKRRSRESVRWEAAERNLISLDGLRMRYKVSKATIESAVAYLGLKLQEIEGSQAKYIDRAKISEISDYLNKA